MTKIYFNNYSTEHLGPIYKDNYIDADGLIVEVDIDLTEVNYMYVNFRVGQLSYTNDVSIVDIENNIVSVPIPTEVLKEGTHQLELVAVMNNGSVIPSRTYKYLVDKSLENPNAVEAESCYPILMTLIEEITDKIDEANDAVERVDAIIENMTNELAEYKEATTNALNTDIAQYKQATTNELEESFNTYSSNTTSNITNVLDNKIAEVDTSLNNKIQEVDSRVNEVIEEVELSEQARKEEHTELVNELSSYSSDMNNVKDRVDVLEAKVTDNEVIVDLKNKVNNHEERITTNEKTIRHQGVLIDALFDLTETISIKEEGNAISLPQSDDGKVIIDELEGNTLVNYCTNGSEELTLNNEINVQGANVTLTDTVDGGLVDVVCEGNTLVNVLNKNLRFGLSSTSYLTCDENGVYNGILNGGNYFIKNADNTAWVELQPNTTYTLKGFLETTCNTTDGNVVFFTQDTNMLTKTLFLNKITEKNQRIRLNKTFTTPSDCLGSFGFYVSPTANFDNLKFSFIVEYGDTTSYEIPNYFEGMKSAFELEDNKVEIVGQSKNLFDTELVQGRWHTSYGGFENTYSSGVCSRELIKIKPNTTYQFWSSSGYRSVTLFDKDKKYIKGVPIGTSNTTYTSTDKSMYVAINLDSCTDVNTSIQLEEGTQKTSYVPYATNTHSIQLSEPLRGLPDGVCDKFVKQGGKWYVERNCGVATVDDLNVSVGYRFDDYNTCSIVTRLKTSDTLINRSNPTMICNTIPYYIMHHYDAYTEYNYISLWTDNTAFFVCQIRGLSSVEEYYDYFRNNNCLFLYPLAKPTYEEIIDLQLITYLDTTHISTNSTIPCNIQVKNSGYNAIIKPSTKYTVAFDTNTSGEVNIGLGGAKTSTTNNVATITTPSTLTDDTLRLYGKGIKASNVRLLEGDKTNYIPNYFEGMKSCFEDKEQDNGSYELEILSNNKNLWEFGDIEGDVVVCSQEKPIIQKGTYSLSGNTEILYDETPVISFRNKNNENIYAWYMVYDRISSNNITFKEDIYGYVFYSNGFNYVGSGGKINKATNIQIERNDIKTEYVPHKQNKIQLQLNEPLRAVGDVKDRFVLKDGKLMIERNCGEIVLNGSEGDKLASATGMWLKYTGINDTEKASVFALYNIPKKTGYKTSICDRFTNTYNANPFRPGDVKAFTYTDHSTLNTMYFDYGDSPNVTLKEWLEWLSQNPTKVIYQLAEPTYEEIPFELQKLILECFENGTLFIYTLIPPTVSVTYSADKPIATTLNQIRTIQDEQDEMILENAVNIAMMNLTI